jgi:acetyl-CoA acyltransferase
MHKDALICDAIRTPIGAYGAGLATIRADDLAALPIKELIQRNPNIDWALVEEVILGCANQAGEDNRNIARMAGLLSGLPSSVAGVTVNRLCGSGLNAVSDAARAIRCGEAELMIAGGVESMSRAPFVIAKAQASYDRSTKMYDTTMGWRFVNPLLETSYGTETMPKTAQNIADQFNICRDDQDQFALWSQTKAARAQENGRLRPEIVAVSIPQRKGDPITFDKDQHLRLSPLSRLAQLKPLFVNGSVTAGNSSGINDGAAALLIASDEGANKHQLQPKARILGMAVAGVEPNIMGIGPVSATKKLLRRLGIGMDQIDVIEINEAFAAQVLACTRQFCLADDDPRVNPLGGAIALGHPLGMSGARLVTSAVNQLIFTNGRYALCTMCVGVGQGIALVIERV